MAVVDKKVKALRHLSVDELVADVRKEHGDDAMVRGADRAVLPRLSTGAIGFDLMLGGGLPAGAPNEVIGEFSSGKTSFVLKLIARNQALDPKFLVLWIASEAFVESWALTAGCDLDRILRFKSQNMEAVYDHVVRFTANRAVDLIVVDSLPALTPMAEYEGDMADVLPALAARTNNKFFRKLGMASAGPLAGQRVCTTIVINQWRSKIGVTQGDPRVTPGGQGKDYAYATRIELRRAEWLQETRTSPRCGIKIAARTIKNKTFPPHRTALVDFYFAGRPGYAGAGSYDVAQDLMVAAMELDIIRRGGNRYTFNDLRWTGKDPVLQALREDLDLQRLVYSETMRAAGLTPDPALVVKPPRKRLARKQ